MYEAIDKEMEFIFLMSDEEFFSEKPKENLKEIEFKNQEEDSEEFELLMITQEEEFIEENKNLLSELASNEEKYFQN